MENMALMTPQELVRIAEDVAIDMKFLKTHQVRRIYTSVSKIKTEFKRSKGEFTASIERGLILLKPKLAFSAGKNQDFKKSFYYFMIDAINGVENAGPEQKKDAMNNFFVLVESVVAYHRFHGKS